MAVTSENGASDAREYVLGFALLGGRKFEVPSSHEEFQRINRAGQFLSHVLSLEEAYDACLANYIDFEAGLVRLLVTDMVREASDETPFHDMRRECARLLSNLLSSCKATLDQVDLRAVKTGGRELRDRVEGLKNDLRHDLDGFRVMESLRNHAQHLGSSVSSISVNQWRDPNAASEENWRLIHSISAYAEIDLLRPLRGRPEEEQAAFRETLERIATRGKEEGVDLVPLVREYILGVGRVVGHFRDLLNDQVDACHGVLLDAKARLSVPGAPTVGYAAIQKVGQKYAQIEKVRYFLWDRISVLRQRNGGLEGLQRFQLQH